MVGLKADLASQSGFNLSLVSTRAGEESASELDLNEELGVEGGRCRVERCSGDCRIHMVGCSDGVGADECNYFLR